MEERPAETNANVDNSASPSVAQLAGRFREQAAAAKEMPASKPARRKPPCSLPLFPPKVELGQNGEEKSPPNTSHLPKVKVKSSPLIEKLQANLAFDPAALLPGASPKSPGLKGAVSPFHSPPSTPSSPGVRSRASEPEEVPISFDQPPEGSHLPCYNKVRTRGSIKRRPPSRRFRKSQSEFGELGDFRAPEPAQENGAREEAGDQALPPQSPAPGSPPPGEEAGRGASRTPGSPERPPLRRTPSRTDPQEGEARAPEEAAPPAPGPGAAAPGAEESGCGGPAEAGPAAEQREEAREPAQQGPDTQRPEAGAGGQGSPRSPPGGPEGSLAPAEGSGEEEHQEGAAQEPGCTPRTGREGPETEDNTPVQDTRM
ncbi:capZ-interacting protein [Myotis myotis]|uniref:RCSD domain containing 1 n=1 Tax=Myotis myotis TaxID=51298 RepID=A0A7J7SSZ2_MYOMY|nr:capZ-interacting protein [Myotis myotis]KAF6291490.1 RCSD domain containing 1 [Myotis myotis]